ncbi:MAG: diacylglycerol kinase family lipid kinase [Coriobacteriales bacterium]|jgi:YegS/Rv2252/BmrU family lipid kinase|nr:diacylglycerol kinase family lipid kinase [Coriobacteriales bacterium]
MTLSPYQKITLLVHAGAGSGTGGRFASPVAEGLRRAFPGAEIELVETRSKQHIEEIGRSTAAEAVICLTGDGSIHDLAQALMTRPRSERPTLGMIPAGSGNDYARTLGMPLDPLKAVELLPSCRPVRADIGRVNTVYFLQTLSFGVDAAVALNTEDLRRSTRSRGLSLYARAAVAAILHEFDAHEVRIRTEDDEFLLRALILAVQNGPTYGSGFKVAPSASITDGILDVSIISGIGKPTALYYLSRIKRGTHERLSGVMSFRSSRLELEFTEQLPIQCDGERLTGQSFAIAVVPDALDVLAAPDAPGCARQGASTGAGTPGDTGE